MNFVRGLLARIGVGRSPDLIDREVQEEIRFHLEMRAAANRAAGMAEREAARAAQSSFGDPRRVTSAGREFLGAAPPASDGPGWLATLLQDIRYGLRMLRRHPLATGAAILSLGLGIGINTANFSIVYGFLHRPLPYAEAERLLFVDAWNPERGDGDAGLTWADLEGVRAVGAFDFVGAYDSRSVTVAGDEFPERVSAASVTPGLFAALGLSPQLGRLFEDADGAAYGFEEVALIDDGLWRRMFAADPEVLGKTVRLNDREITVIGVMPPDFRFPVVEQLWLPHAPDTPTDHTARYLRLVARLRPGVGLETARAQLASLAADAEQTWPDTHLGWTLRGMWFRDGFLGEDTHRMLYMMFAAVALVLLLACANVANLQLARAPEREREFVVRAALGGSRGRLLCQMLTESVVLGLAGGALGVAVAHFWVSGLMTAATEPAPPWVQVALDGRALLYATAISVGTAVLFGILPALRVTRRGGHSSLHSSTRGAGAATGKSLRATLVVAQMALAMVLLVGAALMVRGFMRLQTADPGFDETRLLSLRVTLAGDQYDEPQARSLYFDEALAKVLELPEVEAATATGAIPADDGGADVAFVPVGGDIADDEPMFGVAVPSTAGFFDALGIEFLDGRDFTADEARVGDRRVLVVGAGLAARFWPGESAVGQQLRLVATGNEYTIVGVVPDLQYEEFGEDTAGARLQVHLPYSVVPWRSMALLVRGRGPVADLADPVRTAIVSVDRGQAPYNILSMTERRSVNSWGERVLSRSFGAFGVMAFVLAVFGVYAVIAHSVARRTREMGVRMALGARPIDVIRTVMVSGGRLALAGVAIGIGMAWGVARLLAGAVYGVDASEPGVLLGVTITLVAAALVASLLPARRAAVVDPTEALRAD